MLTLEDSKSILKEENLKTKPSKVEEEEEVEDEDEDEDEEGETQEIDFDAIDDLFQ